MNLPGFIGPSYVSRSPNVAIETLYNWYPESVQAPESKARTVYYPRPGLVPFVGLAAFPLRALFQQNGRAFAVAGVNVYEFFANGAPTLLGTVSAMDTSPATITSNGTQLFITSGGYGNILDLTTNLVTPITSAGYPTATAMGTYLDSYFLTSKGSSVQFNISNQADGTIWNALDFGLRVQASDYIVAIKQFNKNIWLLGSQTSEPWYDSGNANFPFQSVPQVLVQTGCVAPFSAMVTDIALCWLGRSERGFGRFYAAADYAPKRVSTYAVEAIWATYPSISDCVAYGLTWQGHEFAILNFPSGNASWAYDFNENAWWQWSWWNVTTANHDRSRGWVHCQAFNQHFVGDWETGTIYTLEASSGTDNGGPIIWERTAPHLCDEQVFHFYSNFQLDMETGVGGATPTARLNWSDDGGHTFSQAIDMSTGTIGNYVTRCRAAGALGRSRDRAFRVRISNDVPPKPLGAYVDVEKGTN